MSRQMEAQIQLHRTILQRQEANLWNYSERLPMLSQDAEGGSDTPRANRLATQLLSFALGKTSGSAEIAAGGSSSDASSVTHDELNPAAVAAALRSGGAAELANLFDAHFAIKAKSKNGDTPSLFPAWTDSWPSGALSASQKTALFSFLVSAIEE